MAASEQVQLTVNNVKYKKRDGSLYLMGERIAWCPNGKNQFDVAINYSDIKCQKVSPEGKAKVQLQLILLKSDSYVFHFAHSNLSNAKSKRESVKNLLAQMLPKFRKRIDRELEEKNRLLQTDPELFGTYKDLVVSGIITPEEFWASHEKKLTSEPGTSQNVGVSASFLADVRPQADGCNGLKYNLTADTIHSIFATYPAVKKKYLEKVPDTLSEKEFWTSFFQSHYFHRDRVNTGGGNSKDIFTDCVKRDDQDILELLQIGVKDDFNNLNYFEDDDSTKAEGYGSNIDPSQGAKVKPSNTQLINKNIIKRFNHQNAMVLATKSRTETDSKANGDSNTETDGEPKRKKLKESTKYDDLEGEEGQSEISLNLQRSERYSHGPTLVNQVHQELNSRKVMEGINLVLSQCSNYTPRLVQAVDPSQASIAMTELSPDIGRNIPNAHMSKGSIDHILSPPLQEELKQLYFSASELARHFWSCFPATSPLLQDKAVRICKSIESFHQTRVRNYQDDLRRNMVHINVTEHLEDMFSAIYTKFNNWQAKKSSRK